MMLNEDRMQISARKKGEGKAVEHWFGASLSTPYDQITMLETRFQASIEMKLLYKQVEPLDFTLDASFQKGELVMDQRVLLQHGATGENLLYAASLLLLHKLPAEVQSQLSGDNALAFDRLLQEHAPRQTVVTYERYRAGQLESEYFVLDPGAPCLARTVLSVLDAPVMLVYEVVPVRRGVR